MITQVFKRVFFSLNILTAIGLIASLLAGKISPENLPVLSLFGIAFPFFILCNIAFVLFWGVLKHQYFLLSAIIIIISLPTITDTFQFFPKKTDKSYSNTFKVMSYNVRVFDLYNWSQNKTTRNKIFKFIRNESPDIACFQEYFNNTSNYFPVHDSLIKNQRFNNAHIYYFAKKNGHNFGIATYSTYPIINKKTILFKHTHNLAIVSDIKINNDTLRVFNCHLESVRFLKEDYHFIDSITMLFEQRGRKGINGVATRLVKASKKRAIQTNTIFNDIKQSPYPVLLCGDFNDTPASYTYQKICNLLNDSHNCSNIGAGNTYTMFIAPLRIDYILYQSQIKCAGFKTVKVNYSDHYPIVGQYFIR